MISKIIPNLAKYTPKSLPPHLYMCIFFFFSFKKDKRLTWELPYWYVLDNQIIGNTKNHDSGLTSTYFRSQNVSQHKVVTHELVNVINSVHMHSQHEYIPTFTIRSNIPRLTFSKISINFVDRTPF